MIRELIVVEGIHDISAVKAAVDAELVATHGFQLGPDAQQRIIRAARERGVIVLTDPDGAGQRIRKRVEALIGTCKHAHLPREAARRGDNIGVENASPAAIREALARARATTADIPTTFRQADLHAHGLVGGDNSRARRDQLGQALSLGYCNARQLLRRLNQYGVTREEFDAAVQALGSDSASQSGEAVHEHVPGGPIPALPNKL